MNINDSIASGSYSNVTIDQIETVRKLALMWKWTDETVQRGVVRLYNHPEAEFLPGRSHLGERILIATIDANGLVAMGGSCDGIEFKRKTSKAA